MSLESKLSTDRINVHRLAVEQPEREVEFLFDPEQEISEAAWDTIFDVVESNRKGKHWESFVSLCRYIKLVAPRQMEKIAIDDATREAILADFDAKIIHDSGSDGRFDGHENYVLPIKILFPDTFKERDFGAETASELWSNIHSGYHDGGLTGALDSAAAVIEAMPGERSKVQQLIDEHWDENIESWDTPDTFNIYIRDMAAIKFIDPERAAALSFDSTHWKQARDAFRKVIEPIGKKEQPTSAQVFYDYEVQEALKLALSIKILAAEQIKVDDAGVHFIMPRVNIHQPTPLLPEQRKF